jgi:hypothetical protein
MHHSIRHIAVGVLAGAALLVSGCADRRYGEQITTVNYYPSCYAPISELRQADTDYNQTIGVSAVVGAVSGALIGLVSTGRPQGAVVGALAGAAVGTGVGYAKAKQDRIADDNRRMASYLADINGDISGLDRATAAARIARECYDREFASAIAAYKSGRISRDELSRRYEEIRNGCEEVALILDNVIATTGDKEATYQAAIKDEASRANRPVPVVAVAEREKPAPAAQRSPAARKAEPAVRDTVNRTATPAGPAASDTVRRTTAPRQDDHSLEAVAVNTQRLNESRQSAESEQDEVRKLTAEMSGTLADLTS